MLVCVTEEVSFIYTSELSVLFVLTMIEIMCEADGGCGGATRGEPGYKPKGVRALHHELMAFILQLSS